MAAAAAAARAARARARTFRNVFMPVRRLCGAFAVACRPGSPS